MSDPYIGDELSFFGSRLKEERKRLGLTQTEFGKLGNASLNSQTAYERGKIPPTVGYLLKLARHDIDIGYVLTGHSGGIVDGETGRLISALGQLSARERGAVFALILGLLGQTPGNFQ